MYVKPWWKPWWNHWHTTRIRRGPLRITRRPTLPKGPWLFDLELDADESYDVSKLHPEVFARFSDLAETQLALDDSNPRRWR